MHRILQYAQTICNDNVELKNFCQFNANRKNNNLEPTATTASSLVSKTNFKGSKETLPIIDAVKKHVDKANWRQTYSISEVGEDFANRHCYFELIGPTGHFYDDAIRGFICYWGENLNYKWHSHEAEEIYYILDGKALFKTKTGTKVLKTNQTHFHKSWESHAMETLEEPLIAFILWRGNGLDKLARIDK
tara:strand:+ start:144 stop:713 length:570 start_codon:yes stop_codon:yes gene_type:complete